MQFDLRHDLIGNVRASRTNIFWKLKQLDAPDPQGINEHRETEFCKLLAQAMYWDSIRNMFA